MFSAKELHKESTASVVKKMEAIKYDFHKRVQIYLKHGVYVKRKLVNIPIDGKEGEFAVRTRLQARSFLIPPIDERFAVANLLLEKYWLEDDVSGIETVVITFS